MKTRTTIDAVATACPNRTFMRDASSRAARFGRSLAVATLLLTMIADMGEVCGADDAGVLTATGAAISERYPDAMRVRIELSAKGAGLAEALAKLKDRREAAANVLPTLGADVDSIKFSDPQIKSAEGQQQMSRMIAERMGRTKRSTTTEEAVPPTTVTATLTADWRLTAATAEELLTTVDALQAKIKAADLGGTKEAEKLSAEEEELQAEFQAMQQRGGEEMPKAGEPVYLYIAFIEDADRTKLMTEAFEKAKLQAGLLATSAGAKLGGLRSLQSQSQGMGFDDYGGAYSYEMQQYRAQMMRGLMQSQAVIDAHEAYTTTAGKVKFVVQVSTTFALE